MLSTKTNAADQSQFSMTQKLANYVGENSDASTLPKKISRLQIMRFSCHMTDFIRQ